MLNAMTWLAMFGMGSLTWLSAALPTPLTSGSYPEAAAAKASVQPGLTAHALVLASTPKALFPKVLERLLDQDYIILAANPELGLISFRHQGEDRAIRNRRHINVVEGTLLLQEASSTSTRLRVKLTQYWQESSYDTHFETGVQADADAGYYQGFLRMLEEVLPATK
jgi:hypothetical protein